MNIGRVAAEQNQRNSEEIRNFLLAQNTKRRFSWEKPEHGRDERVDELMKEARMPLAELHPDEFQRYLDLFFKFQPKRPFHVKQCYTLPFYAQKKKYKHKDEKYHKVAYPDLVARMLDNDRWLACHPKIEPDWKKPSYWIALREPKRTKFSRIDFDNKHNLLGHYCVGHKDTNPMRPIPHMPLEHFQKIKRIYDAFPNRLWCISSATMGLHIWNRHSSLIHLDVLHRFRDTRSTLLGDGDRQRLHEIGLGSTEIHPMVGRPCRMPFGEDYFTLTEEGLLSDWIDQLNFFEFRFETPSFDAVFNGIKDVLLSEWGKVKAGQQLDWHGKQFNDFKKLKKERPDLYKRFVLADYVVNIDALRSDFTKVEEWAAKGFPTQLPLVASVPAGADVLLSNESHIDGKAPCAAQRHKGPANKNEDAAISLSKICNRQWVQSCVAWANDGLPCHDSIREVVSQLARWFYFIEFWGMPESERKSKITSLLTDFCFLKHNGFISRLQIGKENEVRGHVERLVECGIESVDGQGKLHFMSIRQKRDSGQYKRLIFLEDVVAGNSSFSFSSPLCVGFTLCCSDSENPTDEKTGFQTPADKRRRSAKDWNYEPDNTPLPDEMRDCIHRYYKREGKRLHSRTFQKLTRFINHVHAAGGECRLGIESLKKMGFSDHNARLHINKHLDEMRLVDPGGYYPAGGLGKRYVLTKKAAKMLRAREAKIRLA